jgi:creatinine amidohydrolase
MDESRAKTLKPTNLGVDALNVWSRGWSDAKRVTPEGYFGDPAGFDKTDGNYDWIAQRMADLLESFLNDTYKPPDIT